MVAIRAALPPVPVTALMDSGGGDWLAGWLDTGPASAMICVIGLTRMYYPNVIVIYIRNHGTTINYSLHMAINDVAGERVYHV